MDVLGCQAVFAVPAAQTCNPLRQINFYCYRDLVNSTNHSGRRATSRSPTLVLASGSPRRSDLLQAAGIAFETVVPGIEEIAEAHLTARELTAWNAVRKGMAVARQMPERVVLAADTVVLLSDKVIGKPADLPDAIRILRSLSGRSHHVHSSVFIAHLDRRNLSLFSEITVVRFKKLTAQEIRQYLAKIDPLDKAGAYAAQGHGAEIIAEIEGSFSNVVGLPMERTLTALKSFGITPPATIKRSPFPLAPVPPGAGVPISKPGKETKQ
ncbi:MAG: Maf family protein [Chthoniobacterales bacterium]